MENYQCAICIRDITKNVINLNMNYVTNCKCHYYYHLRCIKKWLNIKNICPICKKNIYKNRIYYYNEVFNLLFILKIMSVIQLIIFIIYILYMINYIFINSFIYHSHYKYFFALYLTFIITTIRILLKLCHDYRVIFYRY